MRSLQGKSLFLAGAAALAFGIAAPAGATTLYFQENPNYSGAGFLQALVFGSAGATGTVTGASGFSAGFTLDSTGYALVNLGTGSNSDELTAGVVQNKGYQITSDSAISGYFLSRQTATTDMSYLIDGAHLGTDYYAATYNDNIGYPEQVSVQATVNNTTVTIAPPTNNGAAPVTITLNAGQTYYYASTNNLTGTHVTSSAPVAVFSGNQCDDIPNGASACDHLDEEMVSTNNLSSTYLLGTTPRSGSGGDVYRVVATQDGTTVTVNGTVVATLNAGQFYEAREAAGAVISANNKILVAQYLPSSSASDNMTTDPAMSLVPGADQWLKSYVFATPSGAASFPADYITIVAKTASLGSLMVAGTAADISGFKVIAGSDYSFGNIDVTSTTGAFSITDSDPFELMLEGYGSYDSYFTYGGAAFAPGASPAPPPTPSVPGAVPEPATWASMILGLGFVGGLMRRRRRADKKPAIA